ncbi:MAG: biotin transporter BioY [Candidatus Omnitrophica bacterium]|nr:biotin transporter BioY [Candidatus Omnitrophota bacterium]
MERIITGWNIVWKRYYEAFASLSIVKKIALSAGFAVLTALSAQLYIPLPFTPVPVTGQVFAVLLAGVLLGRKAGALSQLLYLAVGSAGMNYWFYGSGMGFIRPTTGYIAGFILAAYLIGFLTEKNRSRTGMIFAMLCGITVILSAGTLWLALFLRVPLYKAFLMGFLPFIPLDIVKAYFAGAIANSIIKNRY